MLVDMLVGENGILVGGMLVGMAVRVGFEPTEPIRFNSFRDCPIQPLSHLTDFLNILIFETNESSPPG